MESVLTPTEVTVQDFSGISEDGRELFGLCDQEGKGFVTRDDLHRLQGALHLTDAQLEQIFTSLDEDHNGQLTLEEFADGFGMFLEINADHSERKHLKGLPLLNGRALSPIRELANDAFEDFLEHIDCKTLFRNDVRLRAMWQHLAEDNPSMLPALEEFLLKTSSELQNMEVEYTSLESTFNACSGSQEEQLQQLYENLERKMAEERARLLAEENSKNEKIRQQLLEELQVKNRMLTDIRNQHDMMKDKVIQLKSEEAIRKIENERLQKERDELERRLNATEKSRIEVENEVKEVSHESMDNKKRRERSIGWVSTNVSLEEELIAIEVEKLRRQNKLLLDKKDIQSSDASHGEDIELRRMGENLNSDDNESEVEDDDPEREANDRRGSLLSKYLDVHQRLPDIDDDAEGNFSLSDASTEMSLFENHFEAHTENIQRPCTAVELNRMVTWKVTCKLVSNSNCQFQEHWKVKLKLNPSGMKTILLPEVLMDDTDKSNFTSSPNKERKKSKPKSCVRTESESLFKVILIGDSGVGKTSFIHRFCSNTFRADFASTIGIDFQVKSIVVNNRRTVLQLWDTAGQERFRSISKQYFRKADAVLAMYAVTSEQSFKSARCWIDSIKECSEEGIVLLLVGNKVDEIPQNIKDIIQSVQGAQLAKEYNALFFETSVKNGINVNEAMETLTSSLQEKEDRDMDNNLKLEESYQTKKKRC